MRVLAASVGEIERDFFFFYFFDFCENRVWELKREGGMDVEGRAHHHTTTYAPGCVLL